ncbi:uncharacterized protein [Excalfactoria chinensis]|uniref:uncharacterized protein n=1 Tax=Excalfactoria chinensis TaxID=46218 RepID=UPI003B3A4683
MLLAVLKLIDWSAKQVSSALKTGKTLQFPTSQFTKEELENSEIKLRRHKDLSLQLSHSPFHPQPAVTHNSGGTEDEQQLSRAEPPDSTLTSRAPPAAPLHRTPRARGGRGGGGAGQRRGPHLPRHHLPEGPAAAAPRILRRRSPPPGAARPRGASAGRLGEHYARVDGESTEGRAAQGRPGGAGPGSPGAAAADVCYCRQPLPAPAHAGRGRPGGGTVGRKRRWWRVAELAKAACRGGWQLRNALTKWHQHWQMKHRCGTEFLHVEKMAASNIYQHL